TRPSVDKPFGVSVPLGPEINDETVAQGSSLSSDGLTLVFGSKRPGGQGEMDLWRANRPSLSVPFLPPIPLAELNSPAQDTSPWVSVEGSSIVLYSFRTGGQNGNYWISTRATRNSPFEPPLPFLFPYPAGVNHYSLVSGMTMSADG